MKRFTISGGGWTVTLNASAMHVAIGYGCKLLITKQRETTHEPVKHFELACTFIGDLRTEWYVSLLVGKEWIEQTALGTFVTKALAQKAADALRTPTGAAEFTWVRSRYVEKTAGLKIT